MLMRSPCSQRISLCSRPNKTINYLTDFKTLDTSDISMMPHKSRNSKFPRMGNNMAYAPTCDVRVTLSLINVGSKKGVL
jgi:hypothetical protein